MGKTYVTAEELVNLGWSSSKVTPGMVVDLNNTLERFNIITPEKIQLFLSQCSQESGLGQYTKEIDSGWDYEGRVKDLGNIYYGDGPKYKGAGYIQVTGRRNYQKFSDYIGDPRVMEGVDYVAANHPWLAAGFWWKDHNMNKVIDDWKNNPNAKWPIVDEVSRIVNAGEAGELKYVYGLANRRLYYEHAVRIGIGGGTVNNEEYNVKDVPINSSQVQIKKSEDTSFYRVQEEDTLSVIAAKHGISVESILKANPQISHRDRIKANDDVLYIPSEQVNDSYSKSPGLGDLHLFDQQNMKNIAYLDQQRFSFEDECDMSGLSDSITLQIGQWSYTTEPITGTD